MAVVLVVGVINGHNDGDDCGRGDDEVDDGG